MSILDDFGQEEINSWNSAPLMDGPYEETNKISKVGLSKKDALEAKQHREFIQFTEFGKGFTVCGKTTPKFDAGVYNLNLIDGMPYFEKKSIKSDDWINFREGTVKEIMDEIDLFWEKGHMFEKYGILQRRGFLFYGPAGTGKSIVCKQIMSQFIRKDGVIFLCEHPGVLVKCLTAFREVEPTRKLTVVFEDIDAIIARCGESDLLSYLDGEDSNNYIVNIATTNYPEKLDKRIVARPRRFDRLIKIGYPDDNMRRHYFSEKLFITDSIELEKWVNATSDFTFAALTELVVSVECLDIPFNDAVNKISELMTNRVSSDDFRTRTVGFGR
jgi:SpoVK/Ycf46/Vps4 family AAA+-type ATPase